MTAVLAIVVAVSVVLLAAALAQLLFLPRPVHGSLAESWPYPPGAPRHDNGGSTDA